jgi:CheY-specific phosphatase CheX
MKLSEIEILQKFVARVSASRMTKYSHFSNFKLEAIPNDEKNNEFYGNKMTIIMLWGMIGSFVLKVHFDTNTAIALAKHSMDKESSEIDADMGCDFMKEFCNLQASFIKGFFEKHKLMFGMSLPFLADGQDEIVFRKIRDPRAKYSVWRLSDGEHNMVLSSEICLLEREPIKLIENYLRKEPADSPDEVQFF